MIQKVVERKSIYMAMVCGLVLLQMGGCATNGDGRSMTNTGKGAMIGAASGALLGLLYKDKKKGALIGAIGGGVAGVAVGAYMDKQKKDFEKTLVAERDSGAINVEKLDNDILMIRMTSQTAFDVDSAEVKAGFQSTMDKISSVLVKYGKTQLAVIGHTDSSGSDQHNMKLSEQRSEAVYQYLSGQGVVKERLSFSGKGETDPIASNDTETGRSDNRRVEIFIIPIVDENAKSDNVT